MFGYDIGVILFLLVYFVLGVTFTEVTCKMVKDAHGVEARWADKMLIFIIWPLIVLAAIIGAITRK